MDTRLQNPTQVMRIAVGLMATLAGLDKFFNILADWGSYVSPAAAQLLPFSTDVLMWIVGVVEFAVGVSILTAWPAIGGLFQRALVGETGFLENQRMFLDRNGYLEETFFTFSFSPVRDETGGIGGLFHPVTETTSKTEIDRFAAALRKTLEQPL